MDIAVSTSPAATFMLRRHNTWYSVRDGNWSDPNTWMSNALDKKTITTPQVGDDVYVNHSVNYNETLLLTGYIFNNVIGNLFISGTLTCDTTSTLNQCRLIVTGSLICNGTIDFSSSISPVTLELRGCINSVSNFVAGTNSVIQYNSPFDQTVMPLTYNSLELSNTGVKHLVSDLVVTNTNGQGLIIDYQCILDLQSYNCSLSSCYLLGVLKKTSSTGTVNFNGNITIANSTGGIIFNGAGPTVNVSGNISLSSGGDLRGGFNLGDGTVNVLISQTWQMNNAGNLPTAIGNASILIAAGKTLTIAGPYGTSNIGGWLLNGTGNINGLDSSSTLNIAGAFFYGNSTTIMATGIFNPNSSGTSQIGIWSGLTMDLPFTSFYALTIYGTASLSGNTTVNDTLSIPSGSLQLSTYNLTVAGSTNYSGAIIKSGNGTVSFSTLNNQNSTGSISFTSNPTVNLSGNVTGDQRGGFNLGSGTINITSDIIFGVWTSSNIGPTITWNITISSGKKLRNVGINNTSGGLIMQGQIDGADASATFINESVFTYNNPTAPMLTGELNCNQTLNTFIYGLLGDQDVTSPTDSVPGYQNLTLSGSGTKRLLGDVSVKGFYALYSPAVLDLNGHLLSNP